MKRPPLLTWADILLLALLVAGSAVGILAARRPHPVRADVYVDGRPAGHLPLDRTDTLAVAGPLGLTRVVTGPGTVRVASSPCPGQLCVRSGTARRPGEVIVCLPNRVLVRVIGGKGLDAITQ